MAFLSPPVVPFLTLFRGRVPVLKKRLQKKGYPCSNLSTGEPSVHTGLQMSGDRDGMGVADVLVWALVCKVVDRRRGVAR